MPSNYTNNEFMRMREQAIVNARDMQRRAAIKQPIENTVTDQNSTNDVNSFKSSISFEKYEEPSANNKVQKKVQRRPTQQDNDRMLIMTLLLILIADGADKMLIFALMYIMM